MSFINGVDKHDAKTLMNVSFFVSLQSVSVNNPGYD